MASVGHIRDLKKSTMSIDFVSTMNRIYQYSRSLDQWFEKEAKKAKQSLFSPSDPDREGEAISWHLAHILDGCKEKNRVVFNEITKMYSKMLL